MKKSVTVIVLALVAVVLAAAVGVAAYINHMLNNQPTNIIPQEVTVFDSQGKELFKSKELSDIYDKEYWAYLEITFLETAEIVAQQQQCDNQQALDWLFAQGCQIHTAFDSTAFQALQAVKDQWGPACNTAGAITDLQGNLIAVSSTDKGDEQINYAQARRSPYSSFKALSVYTPAIEKGLVNWSTLFYDSPYKQLKEEDGTMRDWPANATGKYSFQDVSVYEALRTSLNTVAVKCLAKVGVQESIGFLRSSFGIPLEEEKYVLETYGDGEVIGNIALGYLETGITPVEMAGYYQVFANGGLYAQPKTVKVIARKDGSAQYTQHSTPKQVISTATADMMNKLLQGVVKTGGTGVQANCSVVDVAGKTGTGDNYADNWFVGVTPDYSLAIWHGQYENNQADEMFASVVLKLYDALPNANRKFITHENLYPLAYCAHSGKAYSGDCARIETGYFVSKDALPLCDVCGKNEEIGGQ